MARNDAIKYVRQTEVTIRELSKKHLSFIKTMENLDKKTAKLKKD